MSYQQKRKATQHSSETLEDLLQKKFLFSEEEAKTAIESVGSYSIIKWIISKNMHIKGLGLTKKYIYQFMIFMGEECGDFNNWQKYGSLAKESKINDNIEKLILAYKAGLDSVQVSTMKDEDLTISKLRVLAHLKSI